MENILPIKVKSYTRVLVLDFSAQNTFFTSNVTRIKRAKNKNNMSISYIFEKDVCQIILTYKIFVLLLFFIFKSKFQFVSYTSNAYKLKNLFITGNKFFHLISILNILFYILIKV